MSERVGQDERVTAAAVTSHSYLSTACFHGLHDQCRQTCKFCPSKCACRCHPAAAALNCSNCDAPLSDHCLKHLVPCCPGKCDYEGRVAQALYERDAARNGREPCWAKHNDHFRRQWLKRAREFLDRLKELRLVSESVPAEGKL